MKAIIRMGLCAAALWGGAALAQEQDPFATGEVETRATAAEQRRQERREHQGVYVFLGGGAEGYTGALAPTLNPGPAWGATVGFKPVELLGIEAQYSGATHDIDRGAGVNLGAGGATNGADIVRNGGQVTANVDLSTTALRPYVMGGIGIENHNVRGGQTLGFDDDTNGYVPAGLGLRYKITNLIAADARVTYNFGFGRDLVPAGTDLNLGSNRYQGLLQLGGVY